MKLENTIATLRKFVSLLDISVEDDKLIDELLTHPDYPSLLAISDVLHALQIDNIAFQTNENTMPAVPCPFIAQMNNKFVIVTDQQNGRITFFDDESGFQKVTLAEFNRQATGIILAAEPQTGQSLLKRATAIVYKSRNIIAFIGLSLIFISLIFYHTRYLSSLSISMLLLAVIKCLAVVVSVLLLIQSIDQNNPFIQKLCGKSKKMDCGEILSSDAAQVFKGLSWSEVGFYYFSGTAILSLFGSYSIGIIQILVLLNLVSLPYTFYSLYYQAVIAKKWCILCCSIQCLLWLEFLIFINLNSFNFSALSEAPWALVVGALFSPVFVWILLKPLFVSQQQVYPLKLELQKFKYNSNSFEGMLADGYLYRAPLDDWCVTLGNKTAENVITIVSNPYCRPCARAHKLLMELLDYNPNVKAQILFTATNSDDDIKTPVSRHLIALSRETDQATLEQAMQNWYDQTDYESWSRKYPVKEVDSTVINILEDQHAWCLESEIVATPTILLNGHLLSSSYKLIDLKYMLNQH